MDKKFFQGTVEILKSMGKACEFGITQDGEIFGKMNQDIVSVSVVGGSALGFAASLDMDILKRFKKIDDVALSVSGKTKLLINGIEAGQIRGNLKPEFKKYSYANEVFFNDAVFVQTLDKALVSISHDEARTALNCVHLQFGKGLCRFVSTDGIRLSILKIPVVEEITGELDVLIPSHVCDMLKKAMKTFKPTSLVALTQDEKGADLSMLYWQADTFNVAFQIHNDIRFPDVDVIVDGCNRGKEYIGAKASFTKEVFDAIDSARDKLFTAVGKKESRNGAVGIKMTFCNGNVRIEDSLIGFDIEGFKMEVPCPTTFYKDDSLRIGMNAELLADARKVVGDYVTADMLSNKRPTCFYKNTMNDDALYILMPVFIEEKE